MIPALLRLSSFEQARQFANHITRSRPLFVLRRGRLRRRMSCPQAVQRSVPSSPFVGTVSAPQAGQSR